jgi:hypothetical protein
VQQRADRRVPPLLTLSLIAATRSESPGKSAFMSDDLPTPDGPVSAEVRPASASRSASSRAAARRS